jgi:fatty acid synthase
VPCEKIKKKCKEKTKKKKKKKKMSASENDDKIFVTGISGRFPSSRNFREFSAHLYNKNAMFDSKEDRWRNIYAGVPPTFGKIPDLDKFDYAFFQNMYSYANKSDPQLRILHEHCYEAMLDAGISPQTLMGSRTAVIVGVSMSEATDKYMKQTLAAGDGVAILG